MLSPPMPRLYHSQFSTPTHFLFALILLLVVSVVVAAQGSGRSTTGTGGNHIVLGYVFFPSGRRAEGPIQVKLQTYSAAELSLTVDSSGSFMFSSLAPGTYTLVVEAGTDYEIARESVFIDTDVNLSRSGIPAPNASRRYTVMVHLQPKREDRRRPSVVNAALAGVPENARKLYEKALEQSRSADPAKAVESLKAALALYPQFPLAANELGVQYLKLAKPEKAVDVLYDAIQLDPNAFSPRLNLGIALLQTRRFADAQLQLSEALKRNSSAPTAHLYLGLVLAKLENNNEAERELLLSLETNGSHLALAHYYLGGLYWKKHDYARAIAQLEKYLALAPDAPDADRVRTTIKDLRTKL